MGVSEQLTGFELEDLMSWTVSNLQRPFRENFSLEISGIIAEKGVQIFGRRFVRVGKNSCVNGGLRFLHRPFKLSDRGGGVQGYRRTRKCVPARLKLAGFVRLCLPFYGHFLRAFGAVPHAGASFAGA